MLRLTLHLDAPMRGKREQAERLFRCSFNKHALLYQHMTDRLINRIFHFKILCILLGSVKAPGKARLSDEQARLI